MIIQLWRISSEYLSGKSTIERVSTVKKNWQELSKNSLRIIMKIESKRNWIG